MTPALFAAAAIAAAQPADIAALNAAVRAAPVVRLALPPADAEAYALKSAGLARTALERKSDNVTGSLGFLCGLKDSAEGSGAGQMRGTDPHGRFVGAKLSFSFR